jgi:hypothetical protein
MEDNQPNWYTPLYRPYIRPSCGAIKLCICHYNLTKAAA